MPRLPSPRQMIAAINRQARESEAGIEVRVITTDEAATLKALADTGEESHVKMWRIVADMAERVIVAVEVHGQPAVCMLCDIEITGGEFALCLVRPAVELPVAVMAFTLCPDCIQLNDRRTHITRYLRAFWPGIEIPTVH